MAKFPVICTLLAAVALLLISTWGGPDQPIITISAATPHTIASQQQQQQQPAQGGPPAIAAATPPEGRGIAASETAAVAAPAALQDAPRPREPKPCAPGCEKHGVCNTELGRCDCQPFMGGADCSRPLVAACAAAVGLDRSAAAVPAPCVLDTLAINAPVSCECLMGCEALGLMGVRECYVMDEGNATTMAWVKQQIHMRGLAANTDYWRAAVKDAHPESLRRCSGRGIYAPRMPPSGAPPSVHKRCWCHAGFTGDRCERSTADRPAHSCINGCNGRGNCVRNWCHCRAGFYGTDCSLGHGAADGSSSDAPALPAPIGSKAHGGRAPKVYIYDLPPRFNAWMHAGDGGWWQDFDLWGVRMHAGRVREACVGSNTGLAACMRGACASSETGLTVVPQPPCACRAPAVRPPCACVRGLPLEPSCAPLCMQTGGCGHPSACAALDVSRRLAGGSGLLPGAGLGVERHVADELGLPRSAAHRCARRGRGRRLYSQDVALL